jgi:hypothetical protein
MKITYSIWQGSLMKGHSFTASKMSEVADTIKDLNSTGEKLKFEYFITKIEQDNN